MGRKQTETAPFTFVFIAIEGTSLFTVLHPFTFCYARSHVRSDTFFFVICDPISRCSDGLQSSKIIVLTPRTHTHARYLLPGNRPVVKSYLLPHPFSNTHTWWPWKYHRTEKDAFHSSSFSSLSQSCWIAERYLLNIFISKDLDAKRNHFDLLITF